MKKGRISSLLLSLLLMLQLVMPISQAMAATDSSILPPSNLAAQVLNGEDIKLTWSAVYGATGYNIYEITDGQLILRGKSTTASYTINQAAEGSYTYVVSTLSAGGESGPCAPVSVTVDYPEMVPPATLTHTIANGNDVVLTWGSAAYAQSYKVYQIGADDSKVLLSTETDRNYSMVNAQEGSYTFAISAVHSSFGESQISQPLSVTVTYPVMGTPGSLTYSIANGNDVTLKWSSVQYATGYHVYQVTESDKVLVKSVTGTTLTLTNMPSGDYLYEVHSYSDRFGESTEGSQVTVSLGTIIMTAPPNLTFKIQNLSDIVLTWGAVTNATGYKVYQVTGSEKTLVKTVTGTSITFTNMPGAEYVYEVYSYSDRFGESAEGSQVTVVVETVLMEAPGNFAYKIQNGNDAVLTWDTAANATNYKVYQIVNGTKVLKNTVTGTSVTYTNLPEGEYTYVTHTNSTRFGESPAGSELSFTIQHPVMLPPANVTQTIINSTQFSLGWEASSYATSYKVYQVVDGQKVLKQTVTALKATFSNMTPGEYSYVIHAVSSRFGESPEGSPITFTLNGEVMQAPGNPTYVIANLNDIQLKWATVPYATQYKVYELVDGQKVLKTTTASLQATYTQKPEGEYTFVIHSFSSVLGESPEGAEVHVSLVYPEIGAPSNLQYSVLNGNDIKLTWNVVTYGTSYNVYQVIDGQRTLKKNVSTPTVTFANQPEGEYLYEVYAVNNRIGEAAAGSGVSIQLVHPVMQAPANVTSSIANGNDVTLKWDSTAYATAYKVYQVVNGQEVLAKTVTGTSVALINLAVGDYVYIVRSYSDRFGESSEGGQAAFAVSHLMAAPSDLKYSITNGNDVTLSWTAAPYATAYRVYQVVDGVKVLKSTVTSTKATYTNMPEGTLQFIVHSYSDGLGESPEGAELSFDMVYPVMQAPEPLTQTISNGNDITLKWGTSAYATSYRVYQMIDGQKVLKKTQTGTTYTLTNMPEGEYTFEVHSYSTRFGESPLAAALTFTLKWPVVQPPVLSATIFNANNMTFTWQAAAWANEYRLYEVVGSDRKLLYKGTALTTKVYNLSEGTHTFEIATYSTRFGESVTSSRWVQEIVFPVMEAPAASIKLIDENSVRISWNFIMYANGYNVYEIMDGKPVILTQNLNNLSYTISNLSYGTHEYKVTSYSNSFGESIPSNTVTITLDSTPPVTTVQAPAGWSQEAVISFSATDNLSGVADTFYSVDVLPYTSGTSVTIQVEGIHQVSYYSVDKAGNKEQAQTVEVKIDRTAPVTAANGNTGWTGAAVINLSAADAASGAAHTYYSINGSAYAEGTDFTVTEAGINKVSFYSVDAAGNVEQAQTVEVKIDGTAPTTTSDAPAGWNKDSVTVVLSATDAESGAAHTYYSINGSAYAEGTAFTVTEAGINKVSFYSVDAAGNVEQAQTVEVKIDRTAPVIDWNPEGQYDLGTTLTLKYSADDDLSGIAAESMTVTLPDGSVKEVANGFSITMDQPGLYTVKVSVTNGAGLTTEVQKQWTVYIPVTIEVTPTVIKGNRGIFTVRVVLSDAFKELGIDLNTVTLNGVKALSSNNGYYNQAKIGQFKFERADFNWTAPEAKLEFRGFAGSCLIVGQTTVKVQK